LPVKHFAYGLCFSSSSPLPGLGIESVENEPDVCIRLKEWPDASLPAISPYSYSSPNREALSQPVLRFGMLEKGGYFGFFYCDGARFAVNTRGNEIWADWPDENYTLEDAATYLMGPVFGFVLRLRGVTCLHASAVSLGTYAIALVGAPGAGKSTTAAGFACLGYPVLSEDVVALSNEGDHFLVQAGYPRVNLWPDSVSALFRSREALPRISPTWNKQFLTLAEKGYCFESRPKPLGAIFILDEREDHLTAPKIEEVRGTEALVRLAGNTYVNYLLDRSMHRHQFDLLGDLVRAVPVRCVHPLADLSQLSNLCAAIAHDAMAVMSSTSTTFVGEGSGNV